MLNYKSFIFAFIAIVMIAYPFIVYVSLDSFGPSLLSYVLFILLLIRIIVRGEFHQPEQFIQLTLVGSLCLIAAWFNSEQLLRYYPVMMNFSFAVFFALSLMTDTSLVERFGRLFVKDIPPQGIIYMRELTKIWGVVLIINGIVSFYTACCLSLKMWMLYNGLLSYLFLGGFMLIELAYRQFYKRQHQISH
jgi:uncharacterized membrane protein